MLFKHEIKKLREREGDSFRFIILYFIQLTVKRFILKITLNFIIEIKLINILN